MKKFVLLRDNKQSGPYSLETLKEQGLKPFDLIWIENISTAWQYPSEIGELKEYVKEELEVKPVEKAKPERKVYISQPVSGGFTKDFEESMPLSSKKQEPVLETRLVQPLETLKENYRIRHKNKSLWARQDWATKNTFNVAAAFLGLVLSAFVIKKIVDSTGDPAVQEMNMAALPEFQENIIPTQKPADASYYNALSTEVVKTVEKPKKTPPKMKLRDIRKLVKVKQSDYKTGLLGGIEDLRLTVSNNSPHMVDKVTVEVNFLKPNGEVVGTENIYVYSVAPKSSKEISVPASKRGVKVNYRVMNITSQQYRNKLKQI